MLFLYVFRRRCSAFLPITTIDFYAKMNKLNQRLFIIRDCEFVPVMEVFFKRSSPGRIRKWTSRIQVCFNSCYKIARAGFNVTGLTITVSNIKRFFFVWYRNNGISEICVRGNIDIPMFCFPLQPFHLFEVNLSDFNWWKWTFVRHWWRPDIVETQENDTTTRAGGGTLEI